MAKKAARKAAKKSAPKKMKARAKKPAARKAAARKPAPRVAAAPKAPPQPKWKPKGVQDVIANLVVRDASGAIEFYKKALGAHERMRHAGADGKIMHAEIAIGDTVISLNDEMQGPGWVVAAGPSHKPTGSFMIYSPDCDALFNRAVQAGAKPMMPLADMFWGDRMGMVSDPYGQVWMLGTHVRDLSDEEIRKAGEIAMAQMAQQMAQQHAPAATQPPPATPS